MTSSLATSDHHPYRKGVGVMLLNAQGLVFVGQRIGILNSWQMPQGGIEEGQTIIEAALQELREEIGTDHVEILAETKDWFSYDFPPNVKPHGGKFRGQTQKWVAARFLGQDRDIALNKTAHPEFDAWKWLEPSKLPEVIVPFKRPLYMAVLQNFAHLIKI